MATAEGTFIPSSAGRFAAPPPLLAPQPPSPYASRAETMTQTPAYASYNYPPLGQIGAPTNYTNPIFPRLPSSTLPYEQLPRLQTSSAVQLPPINLPAPSGLIDPAIVQQPTLSTQPSPRGDQERRDNGTQEPDPKRPKMDVQGILGPRND